MSGLLAARRVVSRAPVPYDTPPSRRSASDLASAYATACGRWLVHASCRSWASADDQNGLRLEALPPRSASRRERRAHPPCSRSRRRTPRSRVAGPAAPPGTRSRGCRRGDGPRQSGRPVRNRAARAMTGALTLQTSVRMAPGSRLGASRPMRSRVGPGGTASTTSSAPRTARTGDRPPPRPRRPGAPPPLRRARANSPRPGRCPPAEPARRGTRRSRPGR